jgi:hypothetical protein
VAVDKPQLRLTLAKWCTQATKQSTVFALFTSPSKYCNMQNDLSITTDIVPNQWKLLFIDRHIANSVDAVLYRPQHCQSQ